MVDFHNPSVIENDFLALVKLWHVLGGIFIWEFFITLDYEWSVIRRHRQYRWTIWIYSLTRALTLISIILIMIGFDSSSSINCQIWLIFELIFAYSGLSSASLLIILRIIAIWDRNKIAVGIAICAWSTSVAFQIHTAGYLGTCTKLLLLLLTMLAGLLRLRQHGTMFALGQFLWRQGLVWLFLATVAEVPPVVFLWLNVNDPFNVMFQVPSVIVMTIAATRMYRSLTDFTDPGSQDFGTYPTRRGRTANTDPKRIFAAPIPPNRVEVAVHKSSENYPPVNMGQDGPHCADSQSQDRSFVLNICNDLENGVKTG